MQHNEEYVRVTQITTWNDFENIFISIKIRRKIVVWFLDVVVELFGVKQTKERLFIVLPI